MHLSMQDRGRAHWPLSEDRVYIGPLVLCAEAVCSIAYSCCEWFCLFTSTLSSACVGGIDRLWIGLWRTSLLMSACTRGNTRALKDGEGGLELHPSVLVTHSVNATHNVQLHDMLMGYAMKVWCSVSVVDRSELGRILRYRRGIYTVTIL